MNRTSVFVVFAAACGSPSTLELGADVGGASCEIVSVSATVEGTEADVRWSVEGYPQLLTVGGEDGTLDLRLPAVARDTTFVLRATAEEATDTVEVSVTAPETAADLAAGMVRDCGRFAEGVASGDPGPSSITLWTRIASEAAGPIELTWEIDTDGTFSEPRRGTVTVDASTDYTAVVAVDGLEPATTYFYRFVADGESSVLGRTRTAPAEAADRLCFAVASCSSIYSGWFSAYRRIADRADLDLVIHLGDYIYDFVDEDEEIRVPDPYPENPDSLEEWRARHVYYLADPDLRLARARHPWFLLWDNHDVEGSATDDYRGSVQAFREFNPIAPTSGPADVLYRHLPYGDLADVMVIDQLLFRNLDTVGDSEAPSILGNPQYIWLTERLSASTATWRILGNQKMFAPFLVPPTISPDGVFDTRSWDGFPEARRRLYGFLEAQGIDDNIVLSGDAHFSVSSDLVDDPTAYDPATSTTSRGVEFLPTSISRGNFDETLGADLIGLIEVLAEDIRGRNPHNAYVELVQHGYGVLDVTQTRVVAEYWYSPILEPSNEETLGASLTVERGANRWTR
ncbi:MAG: alkaline phosphatase D family protein [Myxococcota bacterium]